MWPRADAAIQISIDASLFRAPYCNNRGLELAQADVKGDELGHMLLGFRMWPDVRGGGTTADVPRPLVEVVQATEVKVDDKAGGERGV